MRLSLLCLSFFFALSCGESAPEAGAGTDEVSKTGKRKAGKGKGGKRKAGKRKAEGTEAASTGAAPVCPASSELKDVLAASALKDTVQWTGLAAVVQCEGPYAVAQTVPAEGGTASKVLFVRKDNAWQTLSVGSCTDQVPADVATKLGC